MIIQVMLRILFCLIFAFVGFGQEWTKPFLVHSSKSPITFQQEWVDQKDLSKHFIYAVQEGTYNALYYRKVSSNNTVSSPLLLLPGQGHSAVSDITGENDGKKIYIVASVKREVSSTYYDLFFLASKDGGLTWSTPVRMPREDMKDNLGRFYPNIRYDAVTKKLWVFYFVAGSIKWQGTICYSNASAADLKFANEVRVFSSIIMTSPLRYYVAEGGRLDYVHHLGFNNGGRLTYAFSKDAEIWGYGGCDQTQDLLYKDLDIAVHPKLEGQVYSLTGLQKNTGVRLVYSYNFFSSCWSATGIVTEYSPEMYKNRYCQTEKQFLFLAYGTKSSANAKNSQGLFFSSGVESGDQVKQIKRPFEELKATSVHTPDLDCTYDSIKKGVAYVSAIFFFESEALYSIYTSQTKIDPKWASTADS